MTPMFAEAGGLLIMISLIIVVFMVIVLIFQLLWNSTMPQVFKLGQITFWEAFRLLLIAGFLFRGGWVHHY